MRVSSDNQADLIKVIELVVYTDSKYYNICASNQMASAMYEYSDFHLFNIDLPEGVMMILWRKSESQN